MVGGAGQTTGPCRPDKHLDFTESTVGSHWEDLSREVTWFCEYFHGQSWLLWEASLEGQNVIDSVHMR